MDNLDKKYREWLSDLYASSKKDTDPESGQDMDSPLSIPDESFDYLEKLGFPGQFPFTRGVQPNMYRGRLWTMRQYAGFGSAEDTNQRFHYLLNHGTNGLSVAFDLPTQIGYDSDNRLAEGEVGKVGVPISSLKDMEILFEGIPLEKISTSMTINSTASILLAFYIALAKKRGTDISLLKGTIQNDILKEYIARGTYIFPPEESMRIITDIFSYCGKNLPRWNTISISGYHIREAGANAIQEVAFTLANAIAYTEAAIEAGLDIDDFGSRISFFFNTHNNFFEEIAKFRAARRLWAMIMKERFGAKTEQAMRMRFHAQTAGSTLTAQQSENNIIRVAIQALAAVLGGTQSLHTNSFDEALALPTEESVQTALRTQQIIAHETGITNSIDPMGGSYYLESLTDRIEKEVRTYLDRIDEMGGAIVAIKQGYFQEEIAFSAYDYQKKVEDGEEIIVGVNKYQTEEESTKNILKIDQAMIEKQLNRLEETRQSRDTNRVNEALTRLESAAESKDNLMPHIINCAECYTTLGEISDCLRDVFGTYLES